MKFIRTITKIYIRKWSDDKQNDKEYDSTKIVDVVDSVLWLLQLESFVQKVPKSFYIFQDYAFLYNFVTGVGYLTYSHQI